MSSGVRLFLISAGLFLLLGPLFFLAQTSFRVEAEVWDHLRAHTLWPSLIATLIFAAGSTLWALFFGCLMALVSWRLPFFRLILPLLMGALFAVPPYVLGFLSLSLLDYSGPVQRTLHRFFGEQALFEPRSWPWAIFIFGLTSSPYLYFSLQVGLRGEVRPLLEAGLSLGDSFARSLRRILWPRLSLWALGGASLVFLEALADFGVADLFGISTLSREIFQTWGSLFSLGGAARLSLLLLALCLATVVLTQFLKTPQDEDQKQVAVDLSSLFPNSKFSAAALGLAGGVFLLLALIPLLQLFLWAAKPQLWLELPWPQALFQTLLIGVLGSVFTCSLVFLLFMAVWRRRSERLLGLPLSATYGLPGSLLGLSSLLFFFQIGGWEQLPSGWIVPMLLLSLVFFLKFGSLLWRGLLSQSAQLPSSLFESAELLSPGPLQMWRKITWPLMFPALRLGFLLVLIEIMKELPATLMLRPGGTSTLALRVHQFASESEWDRASVYALVLICASLICLLLTRLHFLRPKEALDART